MRVEKNQFPGLLVIYPNVHKDTRGYFYESFNQKEYQQAGIKQTFVQDNQSSSTKGILRGFHYQINHPQGQLIWLTEGKILDICLDLRQDSPTFKQWFSIDLDSKEELIQIYHPPGMAHAFYVNSDKAIINYKCTDYYYPEDEGGVFWKDLGMPWPSNRPIVSKRDENFPKLKNISIDKLPNMSAIE